MKGKLWKETICIYAAETIISWATQRMTRNRLILLKKGLICHFLPEVVKSKDVGGFQNRLNTLVGFTVSSELVCHTALWCGVADLEWWPSQGVLSLCDWFSPWAVAHLDILSIPFLFLCSQFFISISRWFQRGSQEKEKQEDGTWTGDLASSGNTPRGRDRGQLAGSGTHLTCLVASKVCIWASNQQCLINRSERNGCL